MCHRAIREMCKLIGIKDIYAKIYGSTNLQHIVKAFMLGLISQKSHAQLATEKGLYLVEKGSHFDEAFPVVVAEPPECRTEKEIKHDETLDFSQVKLEDKNEQKLVY